MALLSNAQANRVDYAKTQSRLESANYRETFQRKPLAGAKESQHCNIASTDTANGFVESL